MAYYHCSPTAGLTVLEPRKPESFEKPARVFMTTLLPMALMYTVRNYEYSYGYTKEGQIYFDEYFPNALEILYRGKSASLYLCDPDSIEPTRIPNEAISETAVPIISETFIPDAYEALLEQKRLGTLVVHRYHELSDGMLNWIRRVEGDAKVPQDLKEKLVAVITEISGEVKLAKPKGATLEDKPVVKITKWMLEHQPLGIDVCDCGIVKIADDIPKELIVERLHIENCGIVKCCEDLEDAVTMICTDCGSIGSAEGEDGMGIGDMLKNAMGGITGALEPKVINAAEYVL